MKCVGESERERETKTGRAYRVELRVGCRTIDRVLNWNLI